MAPERDGYCGASAVCRGVPAARQVAATRCEPLCKPRQVVVEFRRLTLKRLGASVYQAGTPWKAAPHLNSSAIDAQNTIAAMPPAGTSFQVSAEVPDTPSWRLRRRTHASA